MPLPRAEDDRIVPAADVSPWPRPDANTCAARTFCRMFGRGEGEHQMIPGWPYSGAHGVEETTVKSRSDAGASSIPEM
ncbi:hypothetical protein [Streptomyces sp. Je 1-332]|uniref:transposase n=1 Tax=Streptomyces sp. Je 1-332 TaxID=3231270 RepID=UPI00345AC5EA